MADESILAARNQALEALEAAAPMQGTALGSGTDPAVISASESTESPVSNSIAAPTVAASPSPVAGKKRHNPRTNTLPGRDFDNTRTLTPSNGSALASSPSANTSIDPLSQHIILRSNTDGLSSKPSRLRSLPTGPDSPVLDGLPYVLTDLSAKAVAASTAESTKEKKKGFLGRLSMRTKKKDGFGDNTSDLGDLRTEGSNAQVFSSTIGAGGFIPHHKEPPRYIRVKTHNKTYKEFDKMFLAQELIGTRPRKPTDGSKTPLVTVTTAGPVRKKNVTGGAIWAAEFSKDGKYLAAAGCDCIVRVWAVIATAEDRRAHEEAEAEAEAEAGAGAGSERERERLSAPVFLEKPVREFESHSGEILDLSWSKNNFLLSTSMDKTVRLWHISREECLCAFKHKELVSKVAFHPRDDRFFLAGCLDATLRLWSIPDKSIAFSTQLPEMITAVAFSPDGKVAIAGLLNGYCHFFETEGLRLQTQMLVRSSRGRNAKGSKITGIATIVPPQARDSGDAKVLITSTDARIRVYSLRDKALLAKFKGHEHASTQLSASFSDDGKYVICGSEDRKAFIWNMGTSAALARDKQCCEFFDAHEDMVTTALFAPTRTRQLLGNSGDPIYDLCNPPAITLMSVEESRASQTFTEVGGSGGGEDRYSNLPSAQPQSQSPAYISRSTHYDGNIIVTSDDAGILKVFRQDCAANKRKHESWETGSSFSRKLTVANTGLLGRSGSIITRTSASSAAHSRRGSLSLATVPGNSTNGGGTLLTVTGVAPQQLHQQQQGNSSDRILSWRQDIESHGSNGMASIRSERSISPSKTPRTSMSMNVLGTPASEARKQPYAATASSTLSPHFSSGGLNQQLNGSAGSVGGIGGIGAGSGGGGGASTAVGVAFRRPGLAAGASSPLSNKTNVATTSPAVKQVRKNTENVNQAAAPLAPPSTPPSPSPSPAATLTMATVTAAAAVSTLTTDAITTAKTVTEPTTPTKHANEEDPPGNSYSFWNLNKWKGIAGLRASITGSNSHSGPGSSGSSSGSGQSGHHNGLLNTSARSTGAGAVWHARSPLSRTSVVAESNDPFTIDGTVANAGGRGAAVATTDKTTNRASRTPSRRSSSHLMPVISMDGGGGGSSIDSNFLYPHGGPHERSPYTRDGSVVSMLSSELTSSDGEGDGEGRAEGEGEGVEMQCSKCGGRDFKARRVSGFQRLQCSRCGKVYDGEVGGAVSSGGDRGI